MKQILANLVINATACKQKRFNLALVKMNRIILFGLLLMLGSCIGVDEVDDPIVGESIELDRIQQALLEGETVTVSATFFNQYGVEEDVQIIWSSDDESVATVDISGLVTGISAGQTNVRASVGSTMSENLLVTVVADEDDIAKVVISSSGGNQIGIGQELQLGISITNINGEEVDPSSIEWLSDDVNIATVSQTGLVQGVASGFTKIRAIADGIASNDFNVLVGATSRSGTFQGANGYNASGSCELYIEENGDIKLTLSDDFTTDFALGTYIYLSNSTSGGTTSTEGLEIQEITTGGSAVFNVSSIDPSVSLGDYEYVIVLCKPAGITFGYAQLD